LTLAVFLPTCTRVIATHLDGEEEGEEQLVALKEGAAHVAVHGGGEGVHQAAQAPRQAAAALRRRPYGAHKQGPEPGQRVLRGARARAVRVETAWRRRWGERASMRATNCRQDVYFQCETAAVRRCAHVQVDGGEGNANQLCAPRRRAAVKCAAWTVMQPPVNSLERMQYELDYFTSCELLRTTASTSL
jgi:hypothetical protein